MRYFRTADDAVYESVRLQLDEAWGHPTPDGMTVTCVTPAADAPRDAAGRLVLAVNDEFATWEPAASLLPTLLAGKAVEEIEEGIYRAAVTVSLPESP
jgi:hypothetical protein